MKPIARTVLLAAAMAFAAYQLAPAQSTAQEKPAPGTKPGKAAKPALEGKMTLKRMAAIIKKLDKKAKSPRPNIWQFKISNVPVVLVTNKQHNRMRLLVAVRKANTLGPKDLMRISQANFDSTLDARYAIGRDILWAAYIHPMSTLHTRQFISAIGQTVNLAETYGTTYTSGALTFQGGDSRNIQRRKLIDKLLKEGTEI